MFKTAKVHDVIKGEDTIEGVGVLVDRMWPRGVAKSDLDYKEWFKEVARSRNRGKWANPTGDLLAEFPRRYKTELDDNDSEELTQLLALADATLLFAAANRKVNHAVVLKEWLKEHLRK